jgi:hypothetical protein
LPISIQILTPLTEGADGTADQVSDRRQLPPAVAGEVHQ